MAILKSPDNQIFYDWIDLANHWIVNENQFDSDFPSSPQDPGTSLAAHIVENIFDLELDNASENIGGYLPGYDVKNRDAYQIIQLSLATELINERLYECYANEEGLVKFYLIGENISDIGSDVLYEIPTSQLRQKCDNVIVTGYDPPAKRIVRGPYNLFTFASRYARLEDVNDRGSIYYDPDIYTYPKYWVIGDILGAEACKRYKQGYIEFGKPWLNDESRLSADGAGAGDGATYVFDHKEFEKIIGWIYKIEIPFYEQGSTQIELQNKSPRYVTLDGFGELQQRSWVDQTYYKPQVCLTGQEIDFTKGVYLPDSESKKFLGVREVYIYGYELKSIYPDEYYDADADEIKEGLADFVVDLETMMKEPIRLSAGQDYIVAKDPNDSAGRYKIIFSCNVSPNWIDKFGGEMANTTTDFRISRSSIYKKTDEGELTDPDCADYEEDSFWGITECAGYLRDGQTQVDNRTRYWASIFPMGEGNSGYALEYEIDSLNASRIIVVYDWDNPCISILDQRDEVTKTALEGVNIELYAIVNRDLPPPIAYCHEGTTKMLDPRQQIPDLDFSTVENLTGCEYQQALEGLENGDVKIVLPFIACDGDPWQDCQELKNVAEFIYELQNDVVESVSYVCKPDAAPVLGEVIDGKTINSINYSYQDSSQYLISVQAGPKWQGVGGWDSSVYQNKAERIQVEGVVRHVYADNMKCLVQLERIGLLECVNGQTDPLEVGDTVKVTVYNNPISV